MSIPLFRPEVLAAKNSQWAGPIVLARPIPIRLATWVSVLIFIALAAYLVFGEYTRKVRVVGQITPTAGAIKVVADQFGRITTSMVEEGATVMLGQPLFDITTERAGRDGGVDARIDVLLSARRDELIQTRELQIQELNKRAQTLATRTRSIDAELLSREQEVALQAQQVDAAHEKHERYAKLAKQGFVSKAQLSDMAGELLAQQARRKAIESNVFAVRRDLLQTQEEAQTINGKIKLIDSQTEQSIAALGQERAEHDGRTRIRVVAPAAGIVTALTLAPGQAVMAGATLQQSFPLAQN